MALRPANMTYTVANTPSQNKVDKDPFTYLPRVLRLCEEPWGQPSPAGHTEHPQTQGCGEPLSERLAKGEEGTFKTEVQHKE